MNRWGILGCGDVTEVKSGPALQKAKRSSVVACMRRDEAKAKDYAARHNIPRAYGSAEELIHDPDVDAVYIATPPSSHAELSIQAMKAGKPVLVEKPMAMNIAECDAMIEASNATKQSLIVAYYRRALPRFEKLRDLIKTGVIGEPRAVLVHHLRRLEDSPRQGWKTDPAVGGGGLFVDMQSHTLDWLEYTFGPATSVSGNVQYQSDDHPAEDLVSYSLGFESIVATGFCAYAVGQTDESVTIHGSLGSAKMSFFSQSLIVLRHGDVRTVHDVRDPCHVHQPFIERVNAHLLEGAPNPAPPESARRTTAIIETLFKTPPTI